MAGVVALRLAGPSDLLDNDQMRPAAYTTDVVVNNRWVVQRDNSGDIASKPPVCVWISAAWGEAFGGRVTRVALAIPAIIGLTGMCWVAWVMGSRYFGASAGWWSVVALAMSPMGFKQAILARTDSLYGACGALAGWTLWIGVRRGGGRWMWFWGACALAMLTKGPVAALLPVAGLLAWVWPREGAPVRFERRPSAVWHIVGALVVVAVSAAWVWAAYRAEGQAFLDKVLGKELVGHMVQSNTGKPPGAEFYLPVLYYLGRFAPGSVCAAIGLWRILARPSGDAEARRFERYLWWWFVGGMVVFSVAPHQRADLMTPIWVAGSVIAGRAIAEALAGMGARARVAIGAAWIAGGFGGAYAEHFVHASRKPEVRAEELIRELADDLVDRFGEAPALVHATDNSSFQFYLGRRVTRVPEDEALERLAGPEPCAVAFTAKSDFALRCAERGVPVTVLARSGGPREYGVVILGNAAASADARWPDHSAPDTGGAGPSETE